VQHRGGPAGFLKVLDDRTLAFADYAGNRQYITVGNLSENNRVMLFLIVRARPASENLGPRHGDRRPGAIRVRQRPGLSG
jgi:predicted pyridoxine 5'-phosphate oxidase superfamily flavin-nucleotide-binding protein